jgi:hypothetical protein
MGGKPNMNASKAMWKSERSRSFVQVSSDVGNSDQ